MEKEICFLQIGPKMMAKKKKKKKYRLQDFYDIFDLHKKDLMTKSENLKMMHILNILSM